MKDIDNVVFTDEILEKYKDDSEKITELCKKIDKNKKVQEEYKKFLKGEEKLLHAYEKLEQENKILKENAENNDKVVDKVNWENMLLKKENQQIKDNWNKLKEYIRETKLKEFEKSFGKRYAKTFTQAEVIVCNMIIDKMQKLEIGIDQINNLKEK